MRPESGFLIAPNWSKIGKMAKTSQFADMPFLLLSSSLVTGPSFRSISSLFLKLWQFSFARDWPEIRKLEILPSEFCSISGDWVELGIPNLAQMFLIKSYWMLQNSKVTAFTVWVIKGKPTGKVKLPLRTHTHTQIRLKRDTGVFLWNVRNF